MTNLNQYLLAAIEQGKLSKSESGRLSPMVGAVLLRDNVLVEKAHRGELGDGDHAEFTLLQKKLPGEDLRGTVLVTTLEPCTKRKNHRPCYEWIIERGIRKVIIGILDPNPHIYGKGRIQLRDAGVEIEMFPAVLRNEVECDNRNFIEKFSTNPALAGKATFNYNDNNNRFTIGHGDCIFETAWSSGVLVQFMHTTTPQVLDRSLWLKVTPN